MKTELMTESLTVNDSSFTPEFHQFLAIADLDDIYQEYSDSFKELNGIRPRWMYDSTRDEFARAFIQLGREWVAHYNRREEDEYGYEPEILNESIDNRNWIPADKYEALAGEPL